MKVKEITSAAFEQEVLASDKPVLVDFNAEWCGPCRMMAPILEQLAEERTDVKIVAVNVDNEGLLAQRYRISSIPCLILFKNGSEAGRSIGLIPKEQINEFLSR